MSRFNRRLGLSIGLSVTALAISLLAAEFVLRQAVALPLPRRQPEVRYDAHESRHFTLRADQRSFSYGAPATVLANGLRSNGSDSPSIASGTPVVIAVGDSFTFGLGVSDADTWPAKLETALTQQLNREIHVLNAGTISYGTSQELNLLQELIATYSPTMVIHGLYWNDYMNPAPPSEGKEAVVTPAGYFRWDDIEPQGPFEALRSLTNRSALLYTLKSVARAALRGTAPSNSSYGRQYASLLASGLTPTDMAVLRAFYSDLGEQAAQHDFAVVSVVMPVIDLVGTPDTVRHPYPAAVRALLDELDLPFVDGFALWHERSLDRSQFLPQGADAHLNEAGYAEIAGAVAKTIMNDERLRSRLEASPSVR